MLGIEYVRRNISRKNWLLFLLGEVFYVFQVLVSFLIPFAQRELINAALPGQLVFFNLKSITCLGLALSLGIVFVVYIRITSKAAAMSFSSMAIRNFERMFAHRKFLIGKKGSSWYSVMILDETLKQMLTSNYTQALFSIIQFIVILYILGSWNISLVYVVLSVDLVYLLLVVFLSKRRKKSSRLDKEEFLKLVPIVREALESLRAFHRFGEMENLFSRIRSQFDNVIKYSTKSKIAISTSNSFQEISFSIIMICMVVASIAKIRNGIMDVGSLVTIIAFIPQLLLPVKAIGDLFMIEAWAKPTQSIYLEAQQEYENMVPKAFSMPELGSKTILSMNDIQFSYEKSANIKSITLQCENGIATALLGLSGEGKSTIIKLISGEETPSSGQVLFCGVPLAELPDPIQYAFINSYDQDIEILNADILENILVGKELIMSASVDNLKRLLSVEFKSCIESLNASIITVAEKKLKSRNTILFRELGKKQYEKLRCILGLPLFSRLPVDQETGLILGLLRTCSVEKIATILAEAEFGRSYCVKEKVDALIKATGIEHLAGRNLGEHGTCISGGERQRIAMARCLAKENWKFLIIDEPFTGLDALAEEELSQVLHDSTRGKTLLLVTHKLNLVPLLTDKIVILDLGGIAARGTHSELMSNNKLYASLWKAFSAQRT